MGFGLQLDSGDYVLGWLGCGKCLKSCGGPGRVRTVDLFHAMGTHGVPEASMAKRRMRVLPLVCSSSDNPIGGRDCRRYAGEIVDSTFVSSIRGGGGIAFALAPPGDRASFFVAHSDQRTSAHYLLRALRNATPSPISAIPAITDVPGSGVGLTSIERTSR
jgi:hypothetical protein